SREKTASSKSFGSRASSSRMRSSSSSVNPSARWSGCSGATCVKGSSLPGAEDRSRLRCPCCEPPPHPDADRPGGDLGLLLLVHQGGSQGAGAGGGGLRSRARRGTRPPACGFFHRRLEPARG